MRDSLSRFDTDPFEKHPGLRAKVTRAIRSPKRASIRLTAEEAAFLIADGGGPDPSYPDVPTQTFMWMEGGKLLSIVIKGSGPPRCWRL